MYQKDYILRMIEMLRELVAGILGLIKKGEFDKASDQIERIYYNMLKQDSSFFRNIPKNELTGKLLHEHNYTSGHLEVLAELMDVEAELELAQGNKQGSLEYSLKSLMLIEFIDNEQKLYSQERIFKIDSIKKRIEKLKKDLNQTIN